jgi:hypothetical protein
VNVGRALALEAATRALDAAMPLLAGDPTTTAGHRHSRKPSEDATCKFNPVKLRDIYESQ